MKKGIRPKTCFFGRSLTSTKNNMIDQCQKWYNGINNNYRHSSVETYTDRFWKDFMLKETEGCADDNELHCCQCLKQTKTARRRRFKSRCGYYLAIMPNGQIMGVRSANSKYINIDIIPVGADLVKIWGAESELFLMIDDQGQMRGTDVDSAECIFEETLTENFFNVYYSATYSHKAWCVSLKNKHQMRSFYRKPKPAKDNSFTLEIVSKRASTLSTSDSEDSRQST